MLPIEGRVFLAVGTENAKGYALHFRGTGGSHASGAQAGGSEEVREVPEFPDEKRPGSLSQLRKKRL